MEEEPPRGALLVEVGTNKLVVLEQQHMVTEILVARVVDKSMA